jgi:hypothetical protein
MLGEIGIVMACCKQMSYWLHEYALSKGDAVFCDTYYQRWFRQSKKPHENRPMKRAGVVGIALRAD